MRINKYIAERSDLSRRGADEAIAQNRVTINGQLPNNGQRVLESDVVELDGKPLANKPKTITIMLHKPVGFVCSKDGQGSKTIYELLPPELQSLNPVGRLDKDTSGLLLMTNDGDLLNTMAHPSFHKQKTYHIALHKPLLDEDKHRITNIGVDIGDKRLSKFSVKKITSKKHMSAYEVQLSEGRNRQIRRTFKALGYFVNHLHRTTFADYKLDSLEVGKLRYL
jgi:23S rRNA pseudouridine2605 synthase